MIMLSQAMLGLLYCHVWVPKAMHNAECFIEFLFSVDKDSEAVTIVVYL